MRRWLAATAGLVLCGCGSGGGGGSVPCSGKSGTFHGQTLQVGSLTRYYYLYVPAAYDCANAAPVLFDFHGTAGDPAPEEAYGLPAADTLADAQGMILVRPRSRSSVEGGYNTYRWDENPGDIALNVAFVQALLSDLSTRYHLDPKRTYALGFSSGTNMASQFLYLSQRIFAGLALVGGGIWDDSALTGLATGPRIYAVSGYRDYMSAYLRQLTVDLTSQGYPVATALFRRKDDAGHDLYPWHYTEAWSWLDRGMKPAPGSLAAGWTQDTTFPSGESLIEVAQAANGDLAVAGDEGTLWHKDALTGAWSEAAQLSASAGFQPHWSGICLLPSGVGLAVGEGQVARTGDGGKSWTLAPQVPEFQGSYFGYSYLNTVACSPSDGRMVAGGYWTGVKSTNGGLSWSGDSMISPYSPSPSQVAHVAVSTAGTAVAVGYYNYVGRSVAGSDFTASTPPNGAEWFNGAAASAASWWVVGEAGAVIHSADDGVTWVDQSVSGGDDLYAVDLQGSVGMAVGAHGYALLSEDGGLSWRPVPTGLDGFLGGVRVLDAHHVLAVGENGVLEYSF